MISMDKQYRTRLGHHVRVLCVDRVNDSYPVVALITMFNGEEDTEIFTENGSMYDDGSPNDMDLVEYDARSELINDQLILVRDYDQDAWVLRHFAFIKNGKLHCWAKGQSSAIAIFSTPDDDPNRTTVWEQWKPYSPTAA